MVLRVFINIAYTAMINYYYAKLTIFFYFPPYPISFWYVIIFFLQQLFVHEITVRENKKKYIKIYVYDICSVYFKKRTTAFVILSFSKRLWTQGEKEEGRKSRWIRRRRRRRSFPLSHPLTERCPIFGLFNRNARGKKVLALCSDGHHYRLGIFTPKTLW